MTEQYSPSLLDVPVSIFRRAVAHSEQEKFPESITTLRRMVATQFYKKPVLAICAEPNEQKQRDMKSDLRAFAPVALLRCRHQTASMDEKIVQQWPMLAADVDTKENPSVDMIELKRQISRLSFVLLCSFSVRRGLWFVVRLPDGQTPETLAAHFRYLQRLFSEKFGVVLDASKGANPTALRYASWDDASYLNSEATIMKGTYTLPPPKRNTVLIREVVDEDEAELIRRLLMPVEAAGDGERHVALLKASRVVGGLSAANRVNEEVAISALESVASGWPDFGKSQRTIRDGVRHGSREPIYPEAHEIRPAYSRPTPARSPAPHAYRTDGLKSFDLPTKPQPSVPLVATLAVKVDSQPRFGQPDGSIVYGAVLDFAVPDSYPIEWDTLAEIPQAETSEVVYTPLAPIDVTRINWAMHVCAPLTWDRVEAHRAFLACVAPIDAIEVVPALKRLHNLSWKDYVRPPRFYERKASTNTFRKFIDRVNVTTAGFN